MDDVSAAVAEFQQELKNQPNDICARLEIAAAEYKLDSAAGLPYAEEAVRLNPLVPSAHYLLGTAYRELGQKAEAEREFELSRTLHGKTETQ
jgi:Flp pilus assembly protein TadD